MAARYDSEEETIDFSTRHPVDTFSLGKGDLQAILGVVDQLNKAETE